MAWNEELGRLLLDESVQRDLKAQLLRHADEVENTTLDEGEQDLPDELFEKAERVRTLATRLTDEPITAWGQDDLTLVNEALRASDAWGTLPDSLRDLLTAVDSARTPENEVVAEKPAETVMLSDPQRLTAITVLRDAERVEDSLWTPPGHVEPEIRADWGQDQDAADREIDNYVKQYKNYLENASFGPLAHRLEETNDAQLNDEELRVLDAAFNWAIQAEGELRSQEAYQLHDFVLRTVYQDKITPAVAARLAENSRLMKEASQPDLAEAEARPTPGAANEPDQSKSGRTVLITETTEQASSIAVAASFVADTMRSHQAPTLVGAYDAIAAAAAEAVQDSQTGFVTINLDAQNANTLAMLRGQAEPLILGIPTEAYDLALGRNSNPEAPGVSAFTFSVGSEHGEAAAAVRVERATWALREYEKRVRSIDGLQDRAAAVSAPPGAALVIEHGGDLAAVVQDPRFEQYVAANIGEHQTRYDKAGFTTRVLQEGGYSPEQIQAVQDRIIGQQSTEAVAPERTSAIARLGQLFRSRRTSQPAQAQEPEPAQQPPASRTVSEELEHLEFFARVDQLRADKLISEAAEPQLKDLAHTVDNIDEFTERFAYVGPRLMDPVSQRFLSSALDTPEGTRPESLAQSAAWVRANGLDNTALSVEEPAPNGVELQQETELEVEQAPEQTVPEVEQAKSWEPEGVFAELDRRGFAGRMVELRSVQGLTETQQENIMRMARESTSLEGFAARLQYSGAQNLEPFAYKYLTSAVADQEPASWGETGEWVRQGGFIPHAPTNDFPEQAAAESLGVDGILQSAFPQPGIEAVTTVTSVAPTAERAPYDRHQAQASTLTR